MLRQKFRRQAPHRASRTCKPHKCTKFRSTTRSFSTDLGSVTPTPLIRTTLSDGKFYNKQASLALDAMMQRLEEDDIDYAFDNEIFSTSDVLKLKTHKGTWVLNKHNVTKQIWLSSPISGPSKYNYHPPNFNPETDHERVYKDGEGLGGVWLSERDDETKLSALLEREWSEVFNLPVKFQVDF